jgi:TolB-like protein
MSDSSKAVFLSYASQDAEAAKRICEALRRDGVEVWFDQNELVGGDAWDQKIRGQIKTCALFVPLVSAQTEARGEGYFRREWKIAVDRTHDMGSGRAFIVPVVIDDTRESAADVPEDFMRYQWTRLPRGEPTPQFVERTKRLLEAPRRAGPAANAGPAPAPPFASEAGRGLRWRAWAIVSVAVCVAASIGGWLFLRSAAPQIEPVVRPVTAPTADHPAPADKSIAVLPFANLSTEKENEFFADGVQDDVITNLAKIRALTVISRTSTLSYRDASARNLKKIAGELNVAYVLEGSVRRVGSKVHMNAQLINARTDAHLWADTFDGDASDIFALQASLAQKIAGALKATLTPGELTLIERRPTENQQAYELYQRARAISQKIGEDGSLVDYERILDLYGQALVKDPSFALAHVESALVHSIAYWFARMDPSPARAQKTKDAVDAAARLAPDAPETHLALGVYYYRVLRDWNRALAEFRLAEAGLPNDAQLFFWHAATYRRLGQWNKAVEYYERSSVLAPRDSATALNYVQTLAGMRRWEKVLAVNARYLELFPDHRQLSELRARAQFMTDGNQENFLRALAARPPAGIDPTGLVGAYEVALLRGDFAAADRALADPSLTGVPDIGSVIVNPPALHRAGVAFLRGDGAAARRFAEQAITAYGAGSWNERQLPWVRMSIAQAEAFAGRRDEALRDAHAAIAEVRARDVFDYANMRLSLGHVYLVLGRPDDAITCLRESLAGFCLTSPNEFRLDPFWTRVKDDPRFEEILKSAHSL